MDLTRCLPHRRSAAKSHVVFITRQIRGGTWGLGRVQGPKNQTDRRTDRQLSLLSLHMVLRQWEHYYNILKTTKISRLSETLKWGGGVCRSTKCEFTRLQVK